MKLFKNPTLRLRAILGLFTTLTHLVPKDKKKEKTFARHFHIWDSGTSSSLICDTHRFFLRIDVVYGADMIIWEKGNLYNTEEGQELSLSLLRKEIPLELQGTLMVMLAAKQETRKRGKRSNPTVQTTLDAEIPTERDPKIPFRPAA